MRAAGHSPNSAAEASARPTEVPRAALDLTLKSLSLLLDYPSVALQEALPAIGAALAADARLSADSRRGLGALVTVLADSDRYALEENYVALFDRSRTLSLSLFEHVHGESRDRGGAMVSLVETYRAAGFEPVSTDLPDHLPVLLEFLATQPAAVATDVLADAAHILAALGTRLRERREAAYAAAFDALLELGGELPDPGALGALLDIAPDDPTDLQALDRAWTEGEVLFGPQGGASGDGGCAPQRTAGPSAGAGAVHGVAVAFSPSLPGPATRAAPGRPFKDSSHA